MSRGPWLQVATGGHWYPLSPRAEEVVDADIAASLSKICRFGGHVALDVGPYSVAQHSVLVAMQLRDWGSPAEIQLQGLVHDAHEAYPPGDVLSPVKRELGWQARVMEEKAARVVRAHFGVPVELDPMVRHADLVLLATERRDLLAPSAVEWGELPEPMEERIAPWSWEVARGCWIDRLALLREEVRRG